ncbi:MAG: hypothetical protein ABR915_21020, partial [Thermoguttaceae bacterium]
MWVSLLIVFFFAFAAAAAAEDLAPTSVHDYDGGDVYWVRDGKKQPYNGMRQSWVYNRAMTWLDRRHGLDDAIICYSTQSPLPLTGSSGVSRWYGPGNAELENADAETTRFIKADVRSPWDQASLPPLQFNIEQ